MSSHGSARPDVGWLAKHECVLIRYMQTMVRIRVQVVQDLVPKCSKIRCHRSTLPVGGCTMLLILKLFEWNGAAGRLLVIMVPSSFLYNESGVVEHPILYLSFFAIGYLRFMRER